MSGQPDSGPPTGEVLSPQKPKLEFLGATTARDIINGVGPFLGPGTFEILTRNQTISDMQVKYASLVSIGNIRIIWDKDNIEVRPGLQVVSLYPPRYEYPVSQVPLLTIPEIKQEILKFSETNGLNHMLSLIGIAMAVGKPATSGILGDKMLIMIDTSIDDKTDADVVNNVHEFLQGLEEVRQTLVERANGEPPASANLVQKVNIMVEDDSSLATLLFDLNDYRKGIAYSENTVITPMMHAIPYYKLKVGMMGLISMSEEPYMEMLLNSFRSLSLIRDFYEGFIRTTVEKKFRAPEVMRPLILNRLLGQKVHLMKNLATPSRAWLSMARKGISGDLSVESERAESVLGIIPELAEQMRSIAMRAINGEFDLKIVNFGEEFIKQLESLVGTYNPDNPKGGNVPKINIKLEFDRGAFRGLEVWGIESEIWGRLNNIIFNAAKEMERLGIPVGDRELEVRVEHEEHLGKRVLRCIFIDNGPGFQESTLTELHDTTREKVESTHEGQGVGIKYDETVTDFTTGGFPKSYTTGNRTDGIKGGIISFCVQLVQ